jgi:hypothetical protein
MAGRRVCCTYEPSLDELLADEIMAPVLKSAGSDREQLRAMMVETARRIEDRERQEDDEEEDDPIGFAG